MTFPFNYFTTNLYDDIVNQHLMQIRAQQDNAMRQAARAAEEAAYIEYLRDLEERKKHAAIENEKARKVAEKKALHERRAAKVAERKTRHEADRKQKHLAAAEAQSQGRHLPMLVYYLDPLTNQPSYYISFKPNSEPVPVPMNVDKESNDNANQNSTQEQTSVPVLKDERTCEPVSIEEPESDKGANEPKCSDSEGSDMDNTQTLLRKAHRAHKRVNKEHRKRAAALKRAELDTRYRAKKEAEEKAKQEAEKQEQLKAQHEAEEKARKDAELQEQLRAQEQARQERVRKATETLNKLEPRINHLKEVRDHLSSETPVTLKSLEAYLEIVKSASARVDNILNQLDDLEVEPNTELHQRKHMATSSTAGLAERFDTLAKSLNQSKADISYQESLDQDGDAIFPDEEEDGYSSSSSSSGSHYPVTIEEIEDDSS